MNTELIKYFSPGLQVEYDGRIVTVISLFDWGKGLTFSGYDEQKIGVHVPLEEFGKTAFLLLRPVMDMSDHECERFTELSDHDFIVRLPIRNGEGKTKGLGIKMRHIPTDSEMTFGLFMDGRMVLSIDGYAIDMSSLDYLIDKGIDINGLIDRGLAKEKK